MDALERLEKWIYACPKFADSCGEHIDKSRWIQIEHNDGYSASAFIVFLGSRNGEVESMNCE